VRVTSTDASTDAAQRVRGTSADAALITGATEVLAAFVAGTTFTELPMAVVEAAKIAILDGVANLLAGSSQPVARIIARYVHEMGGAAACGVVGWGFKTNPPQAAFANGVFLHCLDFEVQGYPAAHGTSAILPATLALAEAGGATGRAVLTAYAVGWEVQSRLRTAGPKHQPHPFHPPGIFGPLAAAAASGKVLELSQDQIRTALGIAASRTGGLFANNGTMTKSTHPGNAGRLGLEAALLARAGLTSNGTILEAHAGYVETLFGDEFDWDELNSGDLGRRFHLVDPGFNIKRYPAEIYLQWLIDAVLELRQQHNLRPEQVVRLELEVPAVQAALSRPRPDSGLDGKFSWEYCAAIAVVDGHVGIDSFTDATRFSPTVEDMLDRVRVVPNPAIPADMLSLWVEARAHLRDGQDVTARCRGYRGSIANPMNREERVAKFRACANRVLGSADVERALMLVENLDNVADARELMEVLNHARAE
jgi:2-methylcitrate dehydratase PrpD